MVFGATVMMRVKTAVISSDVLARDRLSGALELMLSTSLSLKEMTRGIWMTVRRYFLGPAVVILLTGTMIFLFGLREASRDENPQSVGIATMIFFGLSGLFVMDLIASVWTGMWMACNARQVNALGGMCLLRLMALPWALFFAVMSLCAYFEVRSFAQSFPKVFSMWLLFCVANNVFWIYWSRKQFYENIRVAASERFIPPETGSWWKFWRKPARG
jgi:hypothetical protein